MSELEARFRVRLEGGDELEKFMKKGQRDAEEFKRAVSAAFRDTGKEIGAFALSTGKSLASLALGDIGIASQAKKVLDFRNSVAQLSVTAGYGADKMGELRDQIHAVAIASNQMQGDVEQAMEAFVARTGDIKTARDNMEMYGKVATATGASIKDVALVGVELSSKLGIKDPAKQREALAILTAQGKAGAVEIRDLAMKAPALFSAASSRFGVEGIEGLRGTGALAQVYAHAYGGKATAGMAVTAINQTFTDMFRRKKEIDKLVGHNTKGQDPYEVMKQMTVATGGDMEKLLKNRKFGFLSPTSLMGFGELAKEYRNTGGFKSFDDFKNVSGDFGAVEKDFGTMRGTGAAALKASQISVNASADKNLGDKFDDLAQHADKLAKVFDWATQHLSLTAAALVTGMLAKNLGAGLLNAAVMGRAAQAGASAAAAGANTGAMSAAASFAQIAGPLFAAIAGAAIGAAIDKETGASSWLAKKAGEVLQPSRVVDDYVAHTETDQKNKKIYNRRAAVALSYTQGEGPLLLPSGKGLQAADKIESLLRDLKVVNETAKNINLHITVSRDDIEYLPGGTGTRSPSVKVHRGATTPVMLELGDGQ